MNMTADACFSALKAHDRRFDGVFFTAVLSTGIYCRPVCPAQLPARKHCSFYDSAAAAEAAGFRPCLRCRPEYAPRHADSLALRDSPAVRLAHQIDETLLLDTTLEVCVRQLGISSRHMRRLFQQAYGMEPKQYVTSRRLLFAKQLLQDTRLPIDQVAYAAGFGSHGRLTVQMKRVYGFTPSRLGKQGAAHAIDSRIVLKVGYRPPYAWQEMLAFLGGRATPLERVADGAYCRTIGEHEIIVSNDTEQSLLLVSIPVELASRSYAITQRVRRMFDTDASPSIIDETLSGDPLLAAHVSRHPGLRIPGCWNDFEMLIRVIVGQQISVAGATTVMSRIIDRVGITPAAIVAAGPDKIAATGMPSKRAQTIYHVAVMIADGQLDLTVTDPSAFYDALVAIPGIGPWTAEYLAIRVMRWPDTIPAGDLALQKAVVPGRRLAEKQLREHAEHWRPWRSYATLHLWQSLHNQGG